MSGENNLFISSRSIGEAPQHHVGAPRLTSQRSPRFYYWLAFFLFSLIVAGASIEASDRVHTTSRGIMNQKWAVICSFLSFGVATVVVIMHIAPVCSIFIVNTKLEGLIAVVMMSLWSALVAVISDSNNGLAVDGEGGVVFGNLYYCGWGGFICAIMLFLSYLKHVHFIEVSEEMSVRSDRLNLWIGCFVSSIVLTAAAANVFDHECLGSERYGTKFCNRSLLALVDGAVGCVFAIMIAGMKMSTGVAPWGMELALSVVIFLVNCFSMGLVTAEDGPGAKIGNLFYFSWITLIVTAMLMSSNIEYIVRLKEKDEERIMDVYEQPGYTYTAVTPPQSQPTKTLADYYPSGQSVAPTEYSGEPSRYGDDDATQATTYTSQGKSFRSNKGGRQSFYSQGTSTSASEYGESQAHGGGFYGEAQFSAGSGFQSDSYGSGMDSGYPRKSSKSDEESVASNAGYPQKTTKSMGMSDESSSASYAGYPQKQTKSVGMNDESSRASNAGYPRKPAKSMNMNDDSTTASNLDDSLQKPTGSFV